MYKYSRKPPTTRSLSIVRILYFIVFHCCQINLKNVLSPLNPYKNISRETLCLPSHPVTSPQNNLWVNQSVVAQSKFVTIKAKQNPARLVAMCSHWVSCHVNNWIVPKEKKRNQCSFCHFFKPMHLQYFAKQSHTELPTRMSPPWMHHFSREP